MNIDKKEFASSLGEAIISDNPNGNIDWVLKVYGKPSFTALWLKEEVMHILTDDLFINERRTNTFWEYFFATLFWLDTDHGHVHYSLYIKVFRELLDEETFHAIQNQIVFNKPFTLTHGGGKCMINPDISLHNFANLYYLLQAMQETRMWPNNTSMKNIIKPMKWEVFRIFAWALEKAKKVFSPDLDALHLNRSHLIEDRHVWQHRLSFEIAHVLGNSKRTIMNPSYDRVEWPPEWAFPHIDILSGTAFHPKKLLQYIVANKQHFYDYLEK